MDKMNAQRCPQGTGHYQIQRDRLSGKGGNVNISDLEDLIGNLSRQYDINASLLSERNDKKHGERNSDEKAEKEFARLAQKNYNSRRKNWKWVQTLMKCADTHLQNAAAYHQFFDEVKATARLIEINLSEEGYKFRQKASRVGGDHLRHLLEQIKEYSKSYQQWQTKVENLFDQSMDIFPVPQRVMKLTEPQAAVALADFRSGEVEFLKGDRLTLLDNADKHNWLVKNMFGLSGLAPPVILLIPGLSEDAIQEAIKLRLKLLSVWTANVAQLGRFMIETMLPVFKHWSEKEIQLLKQMPPEDKDILLQVLVLFEKILLPNWRQNPLFQTLQEKMFRLRMILEESGDRTSSGGAFLTTVVGQFTLLEEIFVSYQNLCFSCQSFKKAVYLLQTPKYFIHTFRWEYYSFFTSSRFTRFVEQVFKENDIHQIDVVSHPSDHTSATSSVLTINQETKEATTDVQETSLTEELLTFRVTGVVNSRDRRHMSLEEALGDGIINSSVTTYKDSVTGHVMSISEAMEKGLVVYEITNKRLVREENESYGMIVIKTIRDSRSFEMQSVLDEATGMMITEEEAIQRNILDTNENTYRRKDGTKISITAAIDQHLVVGDEKKEGEPTEMYKIYEARGVFDRKENKYISIKESTELGILDKTTNEYIDDVTGERYGVEDAIRKGLIRARPISKTSTLPELQRHNSIVLEKIRLPPVQSLETVSEKNATLTN